MLDRTKGYVIVEDTIEKYLSDDVRVFYFCGGRGIGKTYSALDYIYRQSKEHGKKFMFMRRTEVEAYRVCGEDANVFKKYSMNEGINISAKYTSTTKIGHFYNNDELIGYCAALSTFANCRGLDYSDISILVYDECVPESRNKRPLRDEGYLMLNALETINRNRIVDGEEELILILLSNAIDLGNPFLAQMGFTEILSQMIFKERRSYTNKERGLHIEKYEDLEISKAKSKGMVYKLGEGTGFNERALSGKFVDNDLSVVQKSVDTRQYIPFITMGEVTIWMHKSNDTYWVSSKRVQAKYNFKAADMETARLFILPRYRLHVAYKAVKYDSLQTRAVLEQMIHYVSV